MTETGYPRSGSARKWLKLALGNAIRGQLSPKDVFGGGRAETMTNGSVELLEALAVNAGAFALPPGADFDPEREMEKCLSMGIRVLTRTSPDYPALLASIPDAPNVLYVKGNVSSDRTLAIVGSRQPTPYGRRTTRALSTEAARVGIVTVSGFARGVDTEAHRAALEVSGQTWAVMGCGLGRCYPPENDTWIDKIIACGGAMISEVPLWGPPMPENFPRRNRIISGLSWGTVIVEGNARSGSLITARCALEQGRAVFAVPGPVDSPMSEGPNDLIRQGACPVRGLQDILDELVPLQTGLLTLPRLEAEVPTIDGQKVLQLIGSEAVPMELLLQETGWPVDRLTRTLMELQILGRVDACPGQSYARR